MQRYLANSIGMVLITGANGRIGNVLVRELNKKNITPRILIRKDSDLSSLKGLKYEAVYGDVLDYVSLLLAIQGCDYVYHLAGIINISNKNQKRTFNVNVNGTKNVIKACREAGVKRLLYTSSIHAIEAPADGSVIDENTPLCSENTSRGIYDKTKAIATREVLKAASEDLDAAIVHPTGVIGPFDFEPSYFGKGMVDLVKNCLKYTINGNYDYVDVRDVVSGIIRAMEKGKGGERYILGGEALEMKHYVDLLQSFTNVDCKTKYLPSTLAKILGFLMNIFSNESSLTPYSVKTLMSNCNVSHRKAEMELGFKPRSIDESIKDQYMWFKENGYLK